MVSVGSLTGDDVDQGRRTGEGHGQTKRNLTGTDCSTWNGLLMG